MGFRVQGFRALGAWGLRFRGLGGEGFRVSGLGGRRRRSRTKSRMRRMRRRTKSRDGVHIPCTQFERPCVAASR